ncbi:MAG: RloB family protein, partial [Alphaproteobacteria bacterium]|nr:RloB family protein [Alphaproteobacteria bacterium]
PAMSKSNQFSRRNQAKKSQAKKILVVCEGKKTEVNYFDAIRQARNIPREQIVVKPARYGTHPKNVIDSALTEAEGENFDAVYIVFDRDQHKDKEGQFRQHLTKIEQMNKSKSWDKTRFSAILSIPCFELWLVLHFVKVNGVRTSDEMEKLLKHPDRLPNYDKSEVNHYDKTKHKINDAEKNAQSLRDEHDRDHLEIDKYCYTNVDLLVRTLENF